MLSSCCGMMRNNANAFGNCVPGCCVSISLITQGTKDSPTQRECVGFRVEKRRPWCVNIKLVILNRSAGKVTNRASLGSSICMVPFFPRPWQQILLNTAAFCRLRLSVDVIDCQVEITFSSQSWLSIIVCPTGKAPAILKTIFLSHTLSSSYFFWPLV